MNEHNEKISALLDEFEHSDQHHQQLDELLGDVNQQYTARRYQMIGAVLRNEMPAHIDSDFSAQVMAKVAQESPLEKPSTTTPQVSVAAEVQPGFLATLFKPLAGLAIAASVAVVAITTVQLNEPQLSGDSNQLASNSESAAKVDQLARIPVISNAVRVSGSQNSLSQDEGMKWKIKRAEPDVQNKLNTYLINHNEFSGSMQGIIPQVRVVGFDGQ